MLRAAVGVGGRLRVAVLLRPEVADVVAFGTVVLWGSLVSWEEEDGGNKRTQVKISTYSG